MVSGLEELDKSQEEILFLPAFYELMNHFREVHPEIIVSCERIEKDSPVIFTFSFLTGFYQMMKFSVQKIGIRSLNIDTFIEQDRIMLQFVMKPKKQVSIQNLKKQKYIGRHVDKRICNYQMAGEFSGIAGNYRSISEEKNER